jgi:hypothetical protein
VRPEDERLVFGTKYLRLGADPATLRGQTSLIRSHPNKMQLTQEKPKCESEMPRKDFVKLMYQGN